MRPRDWLKLLAPALAAIIGLIALRLLGKDLIGREKLELFLRHFGDAAPIVFVGFLGVRPLTLLPGQVFTAVGGMLFGTLLGTVYAMVGSFLAVSLVYVLSRRFGARFMKRIAKGRYPALKRAAHKHDFKFALISTINPLLPTDVAVAAAASSGARYWPTIAGVMIGTLPGTFLTAQFGSALTQGKTIMTVVSAVGMLISLAVGTFVGKDIVKEISRGGGEHDTPTPPARIAARPA